MYIAPLARPERTYGFVAHSVHVLYVVCPLQTQALGDLQVTALLGEGGFAKVFKGLWRGLVVGVKVRVTHTHTQTHAYRFGTARCCTANACGPKGKPVLLAVWSGR